MEQTNKKQLPAPNLLWN